MKVTIFGTGYVGLVTGACLAEMGNHVVCVDIDAGKVERLLRGEIPIYEPGLEPIVRRNHADDQLDFTTDAAAGIAHAEVIFIAVGTPPELSTHTPGIDLSTSPELLGAWSLISSADSVVMSLPSRMILPSVGRLSRLMVRTSGRP